MKQMNDRLTNQTANDGQPSEQKQRNRQTNQQTPKRRNIN